MRLNPELAESLARLLQNSDFKRFLDQGLGKYGEEMVAAMLNAEGEKGIVLKGHARAITAILKGITEAPAYVEGLKERK